MSDKIKHIIAGFLVALVIGLPSYLDSGCLFAGIWPAISGGCIAGGIKEWCDNRTDGNKFDWRDLGCTIAGAAVVALFIVAMHYAKG